MIICPNCGHHNPDELEFCENPDCLKYLASGGVHVTDPIVPVPTPPPPPPPDVVKAHRPDDPDDKRYIRLDPQPPVEIPGGVQCRKCGATNPPDRTFCERCLEPLAASVVQPTPVAHQPWWRRWWHRWFGPRHLGTTAAGTRPARRGRSGRGGSTVVKLSALLVVAAVGVATFGPWPNPLRSVKKSLIDAATTSYKPVRPTGVQASSADPGADASQSIDGHGNTWWAEGVPGLGEGQSLTFTFAGPVDLARVGLTTGNDDATAPRPSRVRLQFSDGTSKDLALEDTHKFQQFGLDAHGVTTVTLTIVTVFPGSTGTATAIAEVEFFTKQ